MARTQKKQRRTKGRPKIHFRVRGGVLAAASVFAFVMVGFAAALSPELAVSVGGILIISSIAMFEKRRRSLWETSMHFKMRQVNEEQGEQAHNIAQNANEIARLKRDIKTQKQEAPKEFAQANPFADTALPNSPSPLRASKPKHAAASIPDIANDDETEYYNSLSDTVVTELMRHAIGAQNINVFMQPIMRLPQRRAKFYEMFARIRVKPGLYVPASRYLALAKKEGLLSDIDELLLMQCLKSIRDGGERGETLAYFLNISPATLKNIDFMQRLLGFLAKNRSLAPQLVFEIRQSDFDDMHPALLQVLRGLGKLGCNLSLDHITHHDFDMALLQSMKVRFLKFDAKNLIASARTEKGAANIWKMKRKLEGNGIGFVAERIENDYMLRELLDFDIHYGQGYHLGKPEMKGAYKKSNAAKHIREARRIKNRYAQQ